MLEGNGRMESDYGGPSWDGPQDTEVVDIRMPAYYQVRPAVDAGAGPVLLALHGWGQRAGSFSRRLGGLVDAGVSVIAAQAPHQIYLDMETRKVGFSWLTTYDRRRGVKAIVDMLDTIVERVYTEYGCGGPLFVLGFSQGVSIAYRYALFSRRAVRGVVACGGDLPPDVENRLAQREPFPVLLVHGDDDEIVPVEKCAAAESQLQDLNWPFDVHRFPGGHDIPRGAVDAIAAWIVRHPSRTRA